MTIFKATNDFCKILQKSLITEKIHNLFYELSVSKRRIIYSENLFNGQFLGYLVENKIAKSQSLDPKLTHFASLLSPEELNILEEAHRLLLKISNTIGSCSLESLLPNAQGSVNPYTSYTYDPNYSDYDLNYSDCTDLISEEIGEALENLQVQFRNHPSLEIIRDCIDNIDGIKSIKQEEFIHHVLDFHQQIIRCSLTNQPANLRSKLFSIRDNSQLYGGRLTRSLIVLRDSIFNLNQFIYQALKNKKPLIFNRDNVFEYKGGQHNWIGKIIYLRLQPRVEELYLRPGDFVIVSLKLGSSLKDGFYRVEKIDGLDSRDFGSSIKFGLRLIDENMVCYPQLLNS